jgi:hypothetical protein
MKYPKLVKTNTILGVTEICIPITKVIACIGIGHHHIQIQIGAYDMNTTYLTKQAEEVAARIQEIEGHTARINRDTIRIKAQAIEIADLKAQELIALDAYNNATRDQEAAQQKLNSILA